jgi:hypothetical protein
LRRGRMGDLKNKLMVEVLKRLKAINPTTDASRYVKPIELGFEITEPCAACPFRSDITPYYFPLG